MQHSNFWQKLTVNRTQECHNQVKHVMLAKNLKMELQMELIGIPFPVECKTTITYLQIALKLL